MEEYDFYGRSIKKSLQFLAKFETIIWFCVVFKGFFFFLNTFRF